MPAKAAAKPKAVKDNVVQALESFIGEVDGVERVFRIGDLARVSDPAVAKWPQHFGPVVGPNIEQATSAPGEKRGA